MTVVVLGAVALLGLILAVRFVFGGRTVRALVDLALDRLPAGLRPRYAQEWEADRAQLSGLAALRWALGLQRASRTMTRRERPRLLVPIIAFDAASLAFAYFAAYQVRFDEGVPSRYEDLFLRSLPIAVVGGLVSLALTGAFRRPSRIGTGTGLAVLTLVTGTALIQPVLVSGASGDTALGVPAGVCFLYAGFAGLLLTVSRAALFSARWPSRRS